MSDINPRNIAEKDLLEIKNLKLKILSLEKREKENLAELKLQFSDIFKKFKQEMNKKVDLKDQSIGKLKLKIADLEAENKKLMFTTNDKHLKEKTELENVILKQEDLIENLYKKNENLISSLNIKIKEINNLKLKLKDEEFINRKNRILEMSPIGVIGSPSFMKNIVPTNDNLSCLNDNNNANDKNIMNKIGEVEYFKSLNQNLLEQIKCKDFNNKMYYNLF